MTGRTIRQHEPALYKLLNDDEFLIKECGVKWGGENQPCRLSLAVAYLRTIRTGYWTHAYWDTIPTRPTSPVWWSDKELEAFESPIVAQRFRQYRDWHKQQFNSIGQHMIKTYPKEFGSLTYEDYVWAVLAVETRAFSCPSGPMDKGSSTWCLVPYVSHETGFFFEFVCVYFCLSHSPCAVCHIGLPHGCLSARTRLPPIHDSGVKRGQTSHQPRFMM